MKQTRHAMACAGSLTPELEGADHTTAHPARRQPPKAAPKTEKGGAKHE